MKGFYSLFAPIKSRLAAGLFVLLVSQAVVAQTCPSPTGLSVANLSTTSATLLWTQSDAGEQMIYDYAVSTNPLTSADWASLSAATAGVVAYGAAQTLDITQLPLTGLQPGTTYYVLLRQNCEWDYSGSSSWLTTSFSTMCEPVAIPLDTMKFTSATFPACWMTGGTILPVLQNSVRYGSEGYAVKLQNSTDASSMLFTPALQGASSASELVFRAYSPSGRQRFVVGVASIDSDITTEIIPVYEDSTIAGQWVEFVVSDKDGYFTEGYVYVIYAEQGNPSTFYVDDILVQEASACRRPSSLQVSDVDETSAVFSWNENGTATEWVLEFTPEGGTAFTVNASSNPFTCTSLEPNTDYKVRVKASCGTSESDYAAVSVSFKTQCGTQPVPFATDFEDCTIGSVPECFITHASGSSSASVDSESSTKVLTLKQYVNTDLVYAVLPRFDADLRTLRMRFSYRYENATYGWAEVGYMTDKNDVSTFVVLDTLYRTTGWTQTAILFEDAPQSAYIAIRYGNVASTYWYVKIDNLYVEPAPTCKAPFGLQLSSIDNTSATFEWSQPSTAQQWEVVWNRGVNTGKEIVTSPSFTMSGLEDSTSYAVGLFVRAICQEGDTSEVVSSSFSFKTRCAAVAIPFYESFDALSSASIPECWDNSLDANITQRWWSSGAGYNATRGLAYYASNSSSYVGQRCLLMTPTLELTEASRLSFRFLNAYPLQARFSVWVYVDGNMNVADTLASALSSSSWEQKTYDLSAYTGKNIIVVFAATTLGGETSPSSVLLDDVEVSALSACPTPEKVWVKDITANSAKVCVLGGDGNIVVEYGDGLVSSVPKSAASDTTVIVLSDLQPTTAYTVTVYAQYDAEHQSRKLSPVSFMTDQIPVTLPYSTTDFSDWLLVNGTEVNYWKVDNDSLCIFNGDTKTKGYKFKKATTSDSEPAVTSNVYAVRSFAVDEDGSYSVQFKWRAGGESSYDFLWALVAPASATIEAGNSIKNTIPAGWTKLGKEKYLNLQTSLQDFEYDVNLSAGDYKLLLYWCNDYSGGTQPGAIVSDLSIRKLSCAYPNAPQVIALAYDSVALSWNSTGVDSYDVKVFEGTTLPNDIETSQAAFESAGLTTTNIVFKGLSPQTDYIAVVRADCGSSGNSKWSELCTFKTLCAPVLLPYSDGFETDNTYYDCWTPSLSEGGYFTTTTASTRVHSGSTAVYGHKATFTSLELSFEEGKNLSDYLITGFAKPDNSGTSFTVGIQKSIKDATTYLEVTTVTLEDNSSWTEFTASFAPLATLQDAADYKYIVINLNAETNISIDDITIEEIPSCPRPAIVTVSDITDATATVDWNPMGTETKWEVAVLNGTEVHKKEIVTAHPHTVTDLQAMTSYVVQVRAICAEEDTSAVRDCSFKTLCSAMALPYMEDFNSLTEGIPDCWNNEEGTTTELAKRWNYSAKGYNSTACVCFNSWNNASGNTNFLTTVPVKITEAAQLSFVYKKQTGSGLDVYLSLDGGLTMADTLAEKIPGEGIGNPGWKDTVLYIDDRFVGSIVSIVFKGTSNYGSSDAYIYLDNLVLEAAPACILSPTLKVEVANVSSDTAKLVVSDEAQENLRWEYVLVKDGMNIMEATPIAAAANTVVLRDLEPATRYSVYVRHYCDEENISSWTAAVPFKTTCVAGELPLTENFNSLKDGIPDCWDNEEGTTTDATNRWNYYADGYNSTACLRFNSYYYSNPNGNTNFLKLLSVNLSEKARVSFVYKKIDGSGLDVYLSVDGGTTYADTLAENLPATSGQWKKVLYGIDDRFVGSVVTIVFKATSNGSYSSNGYIYLDNVVLEAVPDCEKPKGASIVGRDKTSVTFAVQRNDDQTGCTYEYAVVAAGGDFNTASVTACESDTVTISSLTPQTDYLLYVRTVCADDKRSAWLSPIEFSTLCNALELPYTENFGTTSITQNGAVVMPSCWLAYNWVNTITSENATSQSYVRVASSSTYSTNYGRSGNYLYFMAYGYGARKPIYAVMPEFTTPLNQIEISFSTKFEGTSKDSLVLGYLTDVKDNSSFVEIVTIPNATSLTDHTFALCDYGVPAIAAPLAFRYVATSSYYRVGVDDVSVRILDYPAGLEVTDLTPESATIHWDSFHEAPAYETLLITGTDSVRNCVASVSEQLTGLLPMTEYRYKVRAIIAEGDTSAWSKEFTFATTQPAATLPYSCNFEDAAENAYWQMVNSATNKWVIDTAAVKDGLKGLYISNDGGKTNAYSSTSSVVSYTFRRFDLSRGNYLVSFDWRANGEHTSYGCYDYLAVFLVPESEQIVADKYGSSSATVAPENWIPVRNGDALPYTLTTNWQMAQNVVAVPEAGKYNLVFMWKNDGSTTKDPPAAIDNISVSEVNCIPVSGLSMTSLHSTSAGFKWNKNDSETYQVVCLRAGTAMDDALVGSLPTITDSVLTLDTLQIMTSYTLYVRSACGEGEVSDWMQLSFKTPDVAKDLPYSTGFEEGQDQNWSLVQGDDATNKWYVGEAGFKDGVRGLYISADGGTSNTYKKADDRVYAVRSFNVLTAGEYTFEFDYKCEGDYSSYWDSDWEEYIYTPIAYLNAYIVPSTEEITAGEDANPNWTSIETELYSTETAAWKHSTKTVYIGTPGVYSLAFQWYSRSSYSATSGRGGASVDNVEIKQVLCASLQNKPMVSHIASNSALLSWERESDGMQIRIGTSYNIATTGTALLDTIVTLNTDCPLKGLETNTEYYVAVRSVCQSGETFEYSATWKTVSFKTSCEVLRLPYSEDFYTDVKNDECWSLYNGLFTGTEIQTSSLTKVSYNWAHITSGYGISNNHMKLNIFGTDRKAWLVTPSIYIDDAEAQLMFDMALTKYGSSDPIRDATKQADDRFIVFVSSDNGNSWSLSHAREWNNTGSEYVYNNIPNTSTTVTMPLADYAGDTVRIAFYGESTVGSTGTEDNDLHIGNLQIFNGSVEEVKDTICANTDYTGYGFTIPKDKLTPGLEYHDSKFYTENGVTTLYNLSLYVLPEAKVEVRDTACANVPYEKYGFQIAHPQTRTYTLASGTLQTAYGCDSVVVLHLFAPETQFNQQLTICDTETPYAFGELSLTESGVYTQTFQGSLCDSIVTLDLTVLPTKTEITKTICEGESFPIGTESFSTTGDHEVTLKNVLGCDSTIVLHLTVQGTEGVTYTGYVCKGSKYYDDNFSDLTEAGTYDRTLTSSLGCDSIVHLNLVVLEPITNSVQETICNGDIYPFDGQDLVSEGIYTGTFPSAMGCDSIVTLQLTVLPTPEVSQELTLTTEQLPYTFATTADSTYIIEVMPEGTYWPEIVLANAAENGCDSIVNLTLHIKLPESLDYVSEGRLDIVPNIIDREGTVFIRNTFTTGDKEGVTVELFDAVGRRVSLQTLSGKDMMVEGFHNSGMYLLRVTDADKRTFIGQVIVR